MCKGEVEVPQFPKWHLERRGDCWQLIVVADSAPEVDISADAVRLRLSDDEPHISLPLPEKALPLNTDAAHCTFSRRRKQLVIEWPYKAEEVQSDHTAHKKVVQDNRTDEVTESLSAEEWKTRGNAAVQSNSLEEAIRCYSAGLQAGGDMAILHSNRALCLSRLDRHTEAFEDAKCCVTLRPEFVKGYLRGAMALRALKRPEEALVFLKRCPPSDEAAKLVSELKPEAELAERERIAALGGAERKKEEGNALFKKGLFEAAAAIYSEALVLCTEADGALALAIRNNRAACYHQLSDFVAVVKDASFVIDNDPTNLKALVRRMLACEPLEKYEAALIDARAILQQDPRHEMANKVQHRLSKLVRDLQRAAGA